MRVIVVHTTVQCCQNRVGLLGNASDYQRRDASSLFAKECESTPKFTTKGKNSSEIPHNGKSTCWRLSSLAYWVPNFQTLSDLYRAIIFGLCQDICNHSHLDCEHAEDMAKGDTKCGKKPESKGRQKFRSFMVSLNKCPNWKTNVNRKISEARLQVLE